MAIWRGRERERERKRERERETEGRGRGSGRGREGEKWGRVEREGESHRAKEEVVWNMLHHRFHILPLQASWNQNNQLPGALRETIPPHHYGYYGYPLEGDGQQLLECHSETHWL